LKQRGKVHNYHVCNIEKSWMVCTDLWWS